MSDVCVLVVTSNHAAFVRECIQSILNSRYSGNIDIVVVDNASADGTKAILRTFGNRIRLIERFGTHSLSNNINIVLQTTKTKYFLILNPDTVLPSNGIDKLYDFMEKHLDAGACAPQLIFPDGRLQLSCRRFPTPWTFLVRRTPIRWFFLSAKRGRRHLMANWNHGQMRQVDWTLGACIIFRAEAVKLVGYFDERFHLYCEDMDICHRLWRHGWRIYYNPEIVVVHNHQAKSDKAFLSWQSLLHFESMFLYVVKHKLQGFRRPNTAHSLKNEVSK